MIAGVDGCKAGWLVAIGESWPCTKPPELHICPTFTDVLRSTAGCDAVAVDIPIGLPYDESARACDIAARAALAPDGASRVFTTPARQASREQTFEKCVMIQRKFTGRGLSRQTFGIVPKIREVDDCMSPELQRRIREFHPELVWKRLAGRILPSKHQADGLFLRLEIIERHGLGLAGFGRQPALSNAAPGDVLDAVVGLAVAHGFATEAGYDRRLPPGEPERDERGLRMEIWF